MASSWWWAPVPQRTPRSKSDLGTINLIHARDEGILQGWSEHYERRWTELSAPTVLGSHDIVTQLRSMAGVRCPDGES